MEVSRNKLDQLVSATRLLFDKVQNNEKIAGGLTKQCESLQQSLHSTQEVSQRVFLTCGSVLLRLLLSTKDQYRRLNKVLVTGASW